jgi:hypothetical protein
MTAASTKMAARADGHGTATAERSAEEPPAIPDNFMMERTKPHFGLSKASKTAGRVTAPGILPGGAVLTTVTHDSRQVFIRGTWRGAQGASGFAGRAYMS